MCNYTLCFVQQAQGRGRAARAHVPPTEEERKRTDNKQQHSIDAAYGATLASRFWHLVCRRRCVPAKRVDALKEVLRDVSSPVSLLVKGKVSFSAETIVLDAVSMLK